MSLLNFDLANYLKGKMYKHKNYWSLISNLNMDEDDLDGYDLPYIIVNKL